MTNKCVLLYRCEQKETKDSGECIVELFAIGWELYALRVNGYEEDRVVGLEKAIDLYLDWCDPHSPDWEETFNCSKKEK